VNITLLGHHDIASLYALNRVMSLLPEHNYSILLSGDLGTQAAPEDSLAQLVEADAQLCEQLLAGSIIGPVAVQLSQRPHATLPKPNSAAGLQILRDLEPELIISIRYRRILREEAIAIPEQGVLNLHSGILPDYKGVMATFWALLAGEEQIGATLHRITDSGIDTGPVMQIYRRPARPERSYLANVLGLYAGGCNMIAAAVRAIAAGEAVPAQAQTGEGRYFCAPCAAAVRRFTEQGLILADGEEAAEIRS